MSDYAGLIAEVNAKATIPDKQLEAIMTAYPSCWGYAAPFTNKQGVRKLQIAAVKLPEGWSAKDIADMKAQVDGGMPEMIEYFGKFPDNTDDVCMQPFPLLENDKGGTTLCLFMEGDFDHWRVDDEPNLTGEYRCYRDKISPLINKLEIQCRGDVNAILKELADPVYKDILEGTYENRGVMYFLADTGHNQIIEDQNEHRKDEDWGGISNEVPDIQINTDTTVEEEIVAEPVKELSLAEKRKLRQQNGGKPATAPAPAAQATTATPRSLTAGKKDTTLSEQTIKDSLKGSTAPAASKGPFLFTLPSTIRTTDEALAYWKAQAGTCPDNWKHKDEKGNWVPSYKAGFPFEKFTKGSVIREKYNPDGSAKSGAKGFAALDNLANDKSSVATAVGPQPDAPRSGAAPSKLPVIPAAVRDKVIAEMIKLDLKSRAIMSNDDIKAVENKHSTFFQQLAQIPPEDLWKMSYEEIHRLNTTYPDFGSVWLFSLRNYQQQNWKAAATTTKKEETATEAVQVEPQGELTLAQKRALRKQNKAA